MPTARNIKEQLLETYPYRFELHAHTCPVSSCSEITAKELVRRYAALGAHGVVVTNHAIRSLIGDIGYEEWSELYLRDFFEAREQGEKQGVKVLLGMEIRFPQNNNDYLIYGIDEDFLPIAWEYMTTDLHKFYTDCHAPDRLILQAHPFRNGMEPVAPADLDGYEVFNMHPNHNSRVSVAATLHREQGGVIIGGTDFHHPGQEGRLFTCFREMPQDSKDLVRLLRGGDYIFTIEDKVILP